MGRGQSDVDVAPSQSGRRALGPLPPLRTHPWASPRDTRSFNSPVTRFADTQEQLRRIRPPVPVNSARRSLRRLLSSSTFFLKQLVHHIAVIDPAK